MTQWRVRATKGTYFEKATFVLLFTKFFIWAWIRAFIFVHKYPLGEAVIERRHTQ